MHCLCAASLLHSFAASPQGTRNLRPNSVELGVVLSTTSQETRDLWRMRLPLLLPDAAELAIEDADERGFAPFSTGILHQLVKEHQQRKALVRSAPFNPNASAVRGAVRCSAVPLF